MTCDGPSDQELNLEFQKSDDEIFEMIKESCDQIEKMEDRIKLSRTISEHDWQKKATI